MTEHAALFTDGQFTALLAFFGALASAAGYALRWAVTRVTKSMDDSTNALLLATKSYAELATKVEQVHAFVSAHTPVRGVPHLRSGG